MLSSPSSVLSKQRRKHSSFLLGSECSSRNSSLQKVWADDYFSDDSTNYDILASPAAAALTDRAFPKDIPLSVGEQEFATPPRQTRTPQRSLTALLPSFRSPQRSPDRSPQRERIITEEFMPTLTGDKDGQIKIGEKAKGLSGWFSGSSNRVAVGVPTNEEFEDVDMSIQLNNTMADSPKIRERSQTVTSMSSTTPKQATTTSRFSFFGKSTPKTVQLPQDLTTDLMTLDVQRALYPTSESDTFSPAAFKNLQMTAESLLSRMQEAYKSRSVELHELRNEQDVQADELEEASTRADHLKMQLEDMASQVAEQDEQLRRLTLELKEEREERERERVAREKSIELVKDHRRTASQESSISQLRTHTPLDSRQSYRRDRRSDCSFESELDLTEDENRSESDSVFSRSMSPTFTDNSSVAHYPASISTTDICQAKIISVRPAALDAQTVAIGLQKKESQRPKMVKQRSTFEKLMYGNKVEQALPGPESDSQLGLADEGCANCRGGSATVAWDTVGLLRMENRGLKERVEDLDKAVEAALDCVAGLSLRD